jgi:hypothetical protein
MAADDDLVRLFVDTNVFIQLSDLKDLPWNGLFPMAKRIDILVSRTVIDELERHKNGTNDRRRNRARRALKLIKDASAATNFRLELPCNSIALWLVIANGPRPDWEALSMLDRQEPDDRLVAEAVAFGNGAFLLSHDSGPLIRARLVGLSAFEPPEPWLLPPERTDDQRKISQLEQKLRDALSDRPQVLASFGSLEAPQEKFEFIVPVLQPLPASTQSKLVSGYLDLHPPKRRESIASRYMETLHPGFTYGSDADRSYNRELDKYEDEVEKYFSTLHQAVLYAAQTVPVEYVVKNDSGVAAQGLRIEMRVDNDAMLFAGREDGETILGKLTPPKLPVFRYGFEPLDHMQTFRELNQPRDPVAFYWVTRPRYGDTQGALQCADFRATAVWQFDMWVRPEEGQPCTAMLDVSATNLPSPISCRASVSIERKEQDWSNKIVTALLPNSVRKLFESTL